MTISIQLLSFHGLFMAANPPFQFNAFLRALFLIFSAAVCTAILGPPALVCCLLDRSGRWPSFFQRTWAKWLLRTNGIHLNATGLEHLGKDRPYILISNHASILDIPGIIAAVSLPVHFIAKRSLIWFPVLGWFLYLSRHILVDRESSLSALKSLKKAAALMENGTCVIVFAEGTRSPDGQVKEFKRGAFLLALQSKVPIVPISISGTFQMLPRHGWCFWPGTMQIYVDKPILTQGILPREVRPLMQKVREMIIQNLKKT